MEYILSVLQKTTKQILKTNQKNPKTINPTTTTKTTKPTKQTPKLNKNPQTSQNQNHICKFGLLTERLRLHCKLWAVW